MPLNFYWRLLVCPIVFPMVYGGTLLLKVGVFLAWGRWERVDVGGASVW